MTVLHWNIFVLNRVGWSEVINQRVGDLGWKIPFSLPPPPPPTPPSQSGHRWSTDSKRFSAAAVIFLSGRKGSGFQKLIVWPAFMTCTCMYNYLLLNGKPQNFTVTYHNNRFHIVSIVKKLHIKLKICFPLTYIYSTFRIKILYNDTWVVFTCCDQSSKGGAVLWLWLAVGYTKHYCPSLVGHLDPFVLAIY